MGLTYDEKYVHDLEERYREVRMALSDLAISASNMFSSKYYSEYINRTFDHKQNVNKALKLLGDMPIKANCP